MPAPDEQMIEEIARAIHQVEAGIAISDKDWAGMDGKFKDRALRRGRAAHSVIAGKVAELTEALEGREAAMRWVYENGMVPDPVRPKWVSEQFSDAYADNRAALAPYPERTK